MILVKVKHYLNVDGLAYFPLWFESLKKTIKEMDGFIDIGFSINKSDETCQVILFFDSNEKLEKWAMSDEHGQIVDKLSLYKNKPWISERYFIKQTKIDKDPKEIELIGYELCPFTQRIGIILNEKNIPYKMNYIDILNKPRWFATMSPLGEIPLLRFNESIIFKTSVICEFLNDELNLELFPKNNLDIADSRSWIEFGNSLVFDVYNMFTSPDEKKYLEKKEIVYKKLKKLNELTKFPFFYGDYFSMVDTCYAPILIRIHALNEIKRNNLLNDFENLKNWHATLIKKQSIALIFPENYTEILIKFLINKKSYLTSNR